MSSAKAKNFAQRSNGIQKKADALKRLFGDAVKTCIIIEDQVDRYMYISDEDWPDLEHLKQNVLERQTTYWTDHGKKIQLLKGPNDFMTLSEAASMADTEVSKAATCNTYIQNATATTSIDDIILKRLGQPVSNVSDSSSPEFDMSQMNQSDMTMPRWDEPSSGSTSCQSSCEVVTDSMDFIPSGIRHPRLTLKTTPPPGKRLGLTLRSGKVTKPIGWDRYGFREPRRP